MLAQISAAETEDVREAVNAAASAFGSWSARTAYERAGYLYAAHRLMLERADELAWLMTTEQGKPLRSPRGRLHGRAQADQADAAGRPARR